MSIALDNISKRFSNTNYSIKQTNNELNENTLSKVLKSDKTKKIVNYTFNASSSLVSLFTFVNGNFNFLDSIQEKLEPFSEYLSKIAFSVAHVVGAIDLWQKKNLLPFLGYAAAVPTALLSSGYNLWLSVGAAEGLINFAVITDKREVVDDNGEAILDKNKNIQLINGDFSNRGWKNSFSTTIKETSKMLKELCNNPTKIKKISHAALVPTLFLLIGPIIGLLGLKKTEAFIRNSAAVALESSMMLHKENANEPTADLKKKIDLKSPIAQAGMLWMSTAIVDLVKRFDFISDKINNLTHLSLALDRTASTRWTQGILNIKHN